MVYGIYKIFRYLKKIFVCLFSDIWEKYQNYNKDLLIYFSQNNEIIERKEDIFMNVQNILYVCFNISDILLKKKR
jgi:hypothetical protein